MLYKFLTFFWLLHIIYWEEIFIENDKLKLNVSEQFVLSNNKENIDFTLQSTEQYFNGNVTGIVFENN